ncbi:PilN domain-containing protein [Candidatus Microgenomates bacterium]|nr:PilN domain-containing protein [Candidatus Microgenomates bacterium]
MPKKPGLISVNLLPRKEIGFGEKFLNWSLTFGRYIIIGTEIIVLIAFLSRFKLDRDLIDLHDQVKEGLKIVSSQKATEDRVGALQIRLSQIKKINEQPQSGLFILSKIALLTPAEVVFTRINIEGDKITIIGTARETVAISAFVTAFTDSNYFKKDSVLLEKIESSKEGESGLSFTISAIAKEGGI